MNCRLFQAYAQVRPIVPHEVQCQVTVTHALSDVVITVIADSGFTDELILEASDVVALGLGEPVSSVSALMADESGCQYYTYSPVTLTIELSDGTWTSASLIPWVAVNTTSVVGTGNQPRLLGHNALAKLDLKVDCAGHKLCRRVHRV
jgi:hypothetical protein